MRSDKRPAAEPPLYRGASEDVPPPSREVAIREAGFWLEQVEAAMERIESGQGTAHDQRVIHKGPIIVQRLLTYAELEDPDRWLQEHPAVHKVVQEAHSHSLANEPYQREFAVAEAAHYRPHLERARRDLEVLKLGLSPS